MTSVNSDSADDRASAVKVIFIASLSHSGSTLLDLMLNAHSEVISVGELKQLGRFARQEKAKRRLRCTCGADSLLTCNFWTRVSDLTEAGIGRTIAQLNVEDYAESESFDRDNVALFQAISAVAEKQYIVDSSKQVARLARLLENPAFDVFPIFLLRNPKGQICSSRKMPARLSKLQKTPTSLVKLIGNYVRTNREIYDIVKDRPYAMVRYEELVQSPEPVLTSLMEGIGLSFDPNQVQWALPVRHNVGGNGMRRSSSSELKLDERWREHFSLLQKLAIDAGTLPGRHPFFKLGLP